MTTRQGADSIRTGEPAAVPLTSLAAGQEAILACIHGGRAMVHRLMEMGLRKGVRFRVVKGSARGPMIVEAGDTRLMLGHGMVSRVMAYPTGKV